MASCLAALAPALTALARSSSLSLSLTSSAMALWVRRSSLASLGPMSRFRSQSGFLGARFVKSY